MVNQKRSFFSFIVTAPIAVSLMLAAALLSFTNCGYRLSGYGNQIPSSIKTIYIPSFDNKTTRFQAEQFVTFAVREEFIQRSKLHLVDTRSKADSILEGEIRTFQVAPISSTENSTANLYRVRIQLSVKFIDLKTGNIIYSDENLLFVDAYEIDTGDFFSQETKTLREISEKFAETVVATILENF